MSGGAVAGLIITVFVLAFVAAAGAIVFLALRFGGRARAGRRDLVPGPDGTVRVLAQVSPHGGSAFAPASEANHGVLEARLDGLHFTAQDPQRSWAVPYEAVHVREVAGAFAMFGPGLDVAVAGGPMQINVSTERINRLSRNDAKSMREAAWAASLARVLAARGARVEPGWWS